MKHYELIRSFCGWANTPFQKSLLTELGKQKEIKPIRILSKKYNEVSVGNPNGDVGENGEDRDCYRMDIVEFLSIREHNNGNPTFYRGLNYSIGFECKVSLSDLMQDKKFVNYLGWTDFFFFVVTEDLVSMAVNKVASIPTVGVINGANGAIVKMPAMQTVPGYKRFELLQQVTFCQSQFRAYSSCPRKD